MLGFIDKTNAYDNITQSYDFLRLIIVKSSVRKGTLNNVHCDLLWVHSKAEPPIR